MLSERASFLVEIGRLKHVLRQSRVTGGGRRENSAEHSWHLALFALALGPLLKDVDVSRSIGMLLVHDIAEIDAGDFPIHVAAAGAGEQACLEEEAARRIFGLLPAEDADRLHALLVEFNEGQTSSARFARALDKLQPLMLNLCNGGGTWTENGVSEEQVFARYGPAIELSSPELWEEVRAMVSSHFNGG